MLPVKPPPLKDISEFASLGRRTAAKKYHPDRGGNQERMAALNHVADWLEGLASKAASRREASTAEAAA